MLPSRMTRRPPCFLPDESDWTSGVSSLLGECDLIGPSDRLSCYRHFWLACPIDLSLANAFDWPVRLTCPWQTLLIGCFSNQLLVSSMGFLATRCQTCKHADEKTITWKRLLCGDEYATIRCSDLLLTPKQIKQTSTCVTYSTCGGVLKLCTMFFCGSR